MVCSVKTEDIMADNRGKRYSPEFKFEVVMEALRGDDLDKEVADKYGVHPVTLSNWKSQLLEEGHQVYARRTRKNERKNKIRQLEQKLERTEVELSLAKNFLKKT